MSQTDLPVQYRVGDFHVSLLPRAGYETRHIATRPSFGIALEAQWGDDAIGSDRIKPFYARPYTLAWVPAGCDVYSRSLAGGEYLKIEGTTLSSEPDTPFNNRSSRGMCQAARTLRRCLLSCGRDDAELIDALDQLLALVPAGASDHLQGAGLDTRRLRRVLELIESQLSEPLSIEALASEVELSAGYFNRAFQMVVGCTPHRYLMDRRLESARHQLLKTNFPVSVIALDSGFSSHAHLTRRFVAAYGLAPSVFRTVFS